MNEWISSALAPVESPYESPFLFFRITAIHPYPNIL